MRYIVKGEIARLRLEVAELMKNGGCSGQVGCVWLGSTAMFSWFSRRGRFGKRSKRVARRKERDTFRNSVMPAVYLFGALGFFGLMGCIIHFALTDRPDLYLIGGALSLVALPCLFALYAFVRGHHSKALDEP